MADEFDSDNDPFEGIDEAELLQLEVQSSHAAQAALKRPCSNGDESAAKRQRTPIPLSSGKSTHLALAERLLDENFGFNGFRHEQAGAIECVLDGKNVLVVFPTGAGKSLCYQIPAIAFPGMDAAQGEREPGMSGVTIVVSPLIALMKDQVDALRRRGIPADCIDSTKSWDELQMIHAGLRKGQIRII